MQPRVLFFLLSPALTLALPARAATLSGVVLGSGGEPIKGAKIVLRVFSRASFSRASFSSASGQHDSSALSDATGAWSIQVPDPKPNAKPEVKPGAKAGEMPSGQVLVHAAGFALAQDFVGGKPGTIRLQKGTSASGVVLDAAGKPLADVPVRLDSVLNRSRGDFDFRDFLRLEEPLYKDFTARTGADGRWTLADLPTSGEARFEIREPQYAVARAMAKLSTQRAEAAKITLHPAAILTGRVVDEAGKPVAGATVSGGTNLNGGSWAEDKTAANGRYRLQSLSGGAYKVQASDRGQDTEAKWVAEPLAEAMAVEGQEVKLPDIVAVQGALITGVVTDEGTGAPLAGTGVYNHNERGDFYDVSSTNAKGAYRLRVLPGKAQGLHWRQAARLPVS